MTRSSGISKGGFQSGLYTGVVTARSSGVPASDVFYTIAVQGPNGEVVFEEVRPQRGARVTSVDPSASIAPFELGQRVVVHLQGADGSLTATVGTGEIPLGEFGFLAKITGSETISPNRWEYEWEEVIRLADVFTVPDPARTSDTDGLAYNTIEAGNSASGVQGNGVNTANIPSGFEIVPIGNGAVVRLSGFDGISWQFTAVNQLDGTCQE